jgi:hypothetical protein
MGRILCFVHRHAWGEIKTDEAGPYQSCMRCQKIKGSSGMGSNGYDSMPPQVPAAGGGY